MPLDYFIEPRHADMIASSFLRDRIAKSQKATERLGNEKAYFDFFDAPPPDGQAAMDYEVKNGTAIIHVNGAIASAKIPNWHYSADLTYENITETVKDAVLRDDVDRILMSYYSPGGTVTGCAEAADILDKLSSQKPMIAHCQMACSAAYWLASATNKIIVDPTGEVGSIGVIMAHVDISKFLEKWGYDFTLIFSGDRKGDGWPYDPLSPEAKDRFQEDVDFLRGQFVQSVAAYRGIDKQAVHDTQALTYKGQQGIDAGLADDVAFLGDTISAMADIAHADTPSSPTHQSTKAKEKTMAKKKLTEKEEAKKRKVRTRAESPKDDDKKDDAVEEEEEDAENPEEDDENASGGDEDEDAENTDEDDENASGGDEDEDAENPDEDDDKKAAKNPKARIASIIQSKEAKGRKKLAESLAFDTDLSPSAARKLLAAAPRSGQTSQNNGFAAAMRGQGNPQLGPNGGAKKSSNPVADAVSRRLSR